MVLARLGYFSFWLFDNMAILSKIKVLRKNVMTMTLSAMLSWFVSLLLTVIIQLRKLQRLRTKAQRIRSVLKTNPEKKPSFEADLVALRKDFRTVYLTIIKCFGDMFPSALGSGLTLLMGNHINDSHAGLGGLTSAVISCYEIADRIK